MVGRVTGEAVVVDRIRSRTGAFRLPWEDQVKVTDGTTCGFPAPTRIFGAKTGKAAE